mgnify:CR=1 FL=1
MTARPAAVAGMFYPAETAALERAVERLLASAPPGGEEGEVGPQGEADEGDARNEAAHVLESGQEIAVEAVAGGAFTVDAYFGGDEPDLCRTRLLGIVPS